MSRQFFNNLDQNQIASKKFIHALEIMKYTNSAQTPRRWENFQTFQYGFKLGVDNVIEQMPVFGNRAGKGIYNYMFSESLQNHHSKIVKNKEQKRPGVFRNEYSPV